MPLIDEGVVCAAAGANIFGGFDQTVSVEVDLPIILCCLFRNALCFFYRPALTFLLIRQLHAETVRLAFGRKSHQRFMCVALFEKTHTPYVRSKDLVSQDSAQFRLTATLELDEVLNFLVRAKLGGPVEALRRPGIPLRKRARHPQCVRAIHA